MNERFIFLLEKYLDDSIEIDEKKEFENLISTNIQLKKEYDEQKRVKEVLKNMTIKNPSKEVWDSYWRGVYNQLERGIAWIAIIIGSAILIGFGALEVVSQFFNNTNTPLLIKVAVTILVMGMCLLLFSVVREKYFSSKHDKYKEIQR